MWSNLMWGKKEDIKKAFRYYDKKREVKKSGGKD